MGAGMELAGRRKDGSEFPAEISLSAIETERRVLFAAAVRDVTDRKRAEAKFRGLLDAAPDAIVGVDADGRIALVNTQAEQLFGYERGELLGRPVEMLVPDAVRSVHPRHRDRYIADPQPRPMGAGMELAGRRKDGSEFPAEISLSAIETEEGLLVSAAIRDGTDRRQAAIIASSNDAFITKSLDGTITSWNPGAARCSDTNLPRSSDATSSFWSHRNFEKQSARWCTELRTASGSPNTRPRACARTEASSRSR